MMICPEKLVGQFEGYVVGIQSDDIATFEFPP